MFVGDIIILLSGLEYAKRILDYFFRFGRWYFIRRDIARARGTVLFGGSELSEPCDPSDDTVGEF